jgi:hypothetical protein
MNTGFDFIKRLRPAGCAIVLLCFIGFLAVCFSSGRDALPDYVPPESMDCYAQNLPALQSELEENVLPRLDGTVRAGIEGDRVVITVDRAHYTAVRKALLDHFDQTLLDFRQN